MKARVTFEANKMLRAAIRYHYGKFGLATHAEIASWFELYGTSCNDDILDEFEESGMCDDNCGQCAQCMEQWR